MPRPSNIQSVSSLNLGSLVEAMHKEAALARGQNARVRALEDVSLRSACMRSGPPCYAWRLGPDCPRALG